MPFRFLAILLLSAAVPSGVLAQALLRAGPMLGYNTMREVGIWVQTDRGAEVKVRYWPVGDVRDVHHSASAKTDSAHAFCATLTVDSLHEGNTYEYQILIDDRALTTAEPLRFTTQALWAYRSDPPTITFALGSCYYANEPAYDRPGRAYGGSYDIFHAIDTLRPDFMLWLGDNVYLREGDFDARSGILHRYAHARAVPQLQPLLHHTHHYATWDDHDYGPNDSDRSYVHKDWTREAFELFWANPPTEHPQLAPGVGTHFRHGDAEFFLLDNRTFRAPNDCKTCDPKPLLGQDQIDWLIDALVASKAAFKFVALGGQVLNSAPVFENYAANHATEREYLLGRIAAEGLDNVVFLSGDRHHTELSKLQLGAVTLHDFTVSPLTAGATGDRSKDEANDNRVDGTHVGVNNFGTVTLSGPRRERTATLRVYDGTGGLLWERQL